MLTLDDQIAARLRAADYQNWRNKVEAVSGCAKPIRLTGTHRLEDTHTGAPIYHYDGDIFVACGNRRASVCPPCSDRYAADAFHLVRSGLTGSDKGIPATVAEKPRAFITLTAPSFGAVHNHRTSQRGRRMPCIGCGEYHHPDDPRLGAPVEPGTYFFVCDVHPGVMNGDFVVA
jgi:hypothetical protein